MKATIAEVRNLISEEQCWAISDSADKDISRAGWARAKAWATLRDVWGWKQRAIADRAGKSESLVSYTLKAVDDPELDPDQVSWEEAYERVTNPRGNLDPMMSSATPEWATPQDLFDLLDSEFHFTLDVCATPENAKCTQFFTKEDDGLSLDWSGVCWMNPPYGDEIPKWMAKAYESAQAGATVVCLVPARVDTEWWWDFCRYGLIRFLRGRLKFGGAESGAPFPSVVVVFRLDKYGAIEEGVRWWEWRTE